MLPLLYSDLFNLGLIARLTPGRVDRLARRLAWPVLVAVTCAVRWDIV
jgi:hypothetical protein